MHGFAVNVNPDLGAFDRIVPCGISITDDNKSVSSLANQMPGGLWTAAAKQPGGDTDTSDMERVKGIVMKSFSDVFEIKLQIHDRAPTEQELDTLWTCGGFAGVFAGAFHTKNPGNIGSGLDLFMIGLDWVALN
jgi:hypothetical protein